MLHTLHTLASCSQVCGMCALGLWDKSFPDLLGELPPAQIPESFMARKISSDDFFFKSMCDIFIWVHLLEKRDI